MLFLSQTLLTRGWELDMEHSNHHNIIVSGFLLSPTRPLIRTGAWAREGQARKFNSKRISTRISQHLKIFSRGKNINIFASQTIWPNYDLKWINIRSEKILQHLCWLTLTKSLTWLASTAYYKLQVSWHHCRHLSAWLRGDVRGGVTGEAALTITRGIFCKNCGRK